MITWKSLSFRVQIFEHENGEFTYYVGIPDTPIMRRSTHKYTAVAVSEVSKQYTFGKDTRTVEKNSRAWESVQVIDFRDLW